MRRTVLIFNFNEQVQAVWKFLLETRGYRVLVAHDKVAAITMMQDAEVVVCEMETALFSEKPVLQVENRTSAVELLERVRLTLLALK